MFWQPGQAEAGDGEAGGRKRASRARERETKA